jgi:hypothetical protein
MKPIPKLLSKSKIIRGYRCPKAIYLTIHQPELEPKPSAATQAVFDQGNAIGELARTYYPGGTLVDHKPWEFVQSLKTTRELMGSGVEFIYEAAFEYKGCYARADILKFNKATARWTLLEVKSGTKLKQEYIEDVGLQAWILANSGLPLEKICIVHLNPECRAPDLHNLFVEVDVTDQLREMYRDIAPRLNSIFSAIRQTSTPETDIGPHCSLNRDCEFKAHCWNERNVPEVSVFNIPGLKAKVWDYYKKGQVELAQVDQSELEPLQTRMVNAHLNNQRFADLSAIREAMKEWTYPLVFLDFETINPAVPVYPGTGPFEQVPFQFSVHVQREPGAELEHYEYLHEDESDPRPGLIPALLEACGEQGSIVSYFARFEQGCIEAMARFSPEHHDELMALVTRLVDPLLVIREHVYDTGFAGSFSLKKVAPALCGQEFSYENLSVADGTAAQRAFTELINPATDEMRKMELNESMLEYCRQDTLAMVKLVDWMRGVP